MMLAFKSLQEAQRGWVKHNFPTRESHYPLLGVVEEFGELCEAMVILMVVGTRIGRLCHSHLKALQRIRGTQEEHMSAARDAVADIVIFLSDYCSAMGFDMQEIVDSTWEQVSKRDWVKDPIGGGK